jgi:hypothetical protein
MATDNDFDREYDPSDMTGIESDWNVEDEYKAPPLIPSGWYDANVTEVKLDVEKQAIAFTYTFDGNGGVMTDGETPIDGAQLTGRIWLPKPGDDKEYTKNGRSTKRQAKINMMQNFGKKTGMSLNIPMEVITAIQNSDWIGNTVKVKVGASEYQGSVFNQVDDVKAA